MAHGSGFLFDLVIVLGVAALTTVVFHRLRQPVVLGYVVAGIIISPHTSLPVVADAHLVATLSELGVILLMFSIGIEFSIRHIARVGAPAAMTAVIEVGLMVAVGYLLGGLFGWTTHESLFVGACLGISSTMVVARTFSELGVRGGFVEVVFAILVFEDILAIVLMAVLTGVASGAGLSSSALLATLGQLVGFLAAMLIGGLLIIPRVIRAVARLDSPETLLVASMGTCFAMALAAEESGYSVALGAFVAGMLVSESGEGKRVEHLIAPFRDVFAAVFFVSVGMTIDPAQMAGAWLPIVVLAPVVVVGKLTGVTVGALLTGNGLRPAVRSGMSMAQIGEFSFIIAGLGISSGATREFILPVAVAVSCLTTLTTPLLVRISDRTSTWVDGRLPHPLQTFVALYTSWIAQLRARPTRERRWTRLRRPVVVLTVDAVLLAAVVIATTTQRHALTGWLGARVELSDTALTVVIVVAAALVAGLFLLGVLRNAAELARRLALEIVPASAEGAVDLGRAPRRVLTLTVELVALLVIGVPLATLLLPFVPLAAVVVGVAVIGVLAIAVGRSLVDLEGHVRAGSALIVEILARQGHQPAQAPALDTLGDVLPGMTGLRSVQLDERCPAVDRSLGDLDLRALTGATVLAITRGDGGAVLPAAGEVLRAGDVLALAGPAESLDAACVVLLGEPPG